MAAEAEKRAGRLGRQVGTTFEALERRLLRQADGVVLHHRRLPRRCSTAGASTHERAARSSRTGRRSTTCPTRHRDNGWRGRARARRPLRLPLHGHAGPQAPARAAVPAWPSSAADAEVVVVSEGMGEQRLREMLREPPAAQPAAAAVPADRALPRHPRGGRRARRPARADRGHVLGAVEGAVVPVRGPPDPGGHPAREPGGPHHRARRRRAGGRRPPTRRPSCVAAKQPPRRGQPAPRLGTGGPRLR